MSTTSFRITGAEGEPIAGDLHLPDLGSLGQGSAPANAGSAAVPNTSVASARVPLVVIMHGFKGFKDWGPWAPICDRLCDHGIAALRFNLSHNGVGEDGVDYSALDKFERNTIAAELFDLHAVLAAIRDERIVPPGRIDFERIFLLGHSRGGAGVLLGGHEDLQKDNDPQLAGIITWAAISTYERGWAVEAQEIWNRGESIPVLNSRTQQMMPLGPQLYLDYAAHQDRYDIAAASAALGRRGVPLLLVHGTEDPTVPVSEASEIRRWYEQGRGEGSSAGSDHSSGDDRSTGSPEHRRAEVLEIEGADHTFQSRHPFDGWSDSLETAFVRSLDFIQAQLGVPSG